MVNNMRHKNNMRDKVGTREDGPVVGTKKVTVEKGMVHLDKKKDTIEIGKGMENAGVGAKRAMDEMESMPSSDEAAGTKSTGSNVKSSWIKGSSESKKMGGSQNVKAKL